MAIKEHPATGTVLLCDFDQVFCAPEMIKRRPVVVISPKIRVRAGLCTVVALSGSKPDLVMPYHCELRLNPPLPDPWCNERYWIKGDMVYAVGFHRLDLVRLGRDPATGARIYRYDTLSAEQLREVRACVLCALGMAALKKHL